MTAGELRIRLHRALESWGVDPAEFADDERSLLGAGALDSLALFNLSMWLEEQLGRPIDPASLDVMTEWDSVASILRFVEREAAHAPAPASAGVSPGAASAPLPGSAPLLDAGVAATTVAPAAPAPESGYRIVRYQPEHRAAVARLLCGLWSPDPALNEAVFRWKYETNPFAGETLIYVALDDGHPVAMRAFCRSAWECGASAPAETPYVADDFVVDETHRNQGLFNLFTEAALADLQARGETFFLSLSALRVTRLQLLASGSRSVGALPTIALRPTWVRWLDALSERLARTPALWRIVQHWMPGDSAARSFGRLDAHPALSHRHGLDIQVTADPPATEMAALVARLSHDGRLRHRRDERFFTWRYHHPLHAYRVVLARRNGRLVGYLVLQRGLSAFANPRRINIVDWACEHPDALAALVQAARHGGRIADLVTWSEPGSAAVFGRLGFRVADQHQASRGLPCVLVRVLDPAGSAQPRLGGKPVLDPASWDLRMAYTSFA